MPRYEFVGGDPIDHFRLGRVEPGDVVEFDHTPPDEGSWKAATRRPSSAHSAEPDLPAEHGSDVPDTSEEV